MNKKEIEDGQTSEKVKQEILRDLKKRNYRITNQRRMLLDIILEGNCTCCKEIYYKAAQKDPKIGSATVYRMINTLEEIGAISRKNQYQIQCSQWDDTKGSCKIILDDETEIELSEQTWKQVVVSGLRCCGILDHQKLQSIELAGGSAL